MNIIFSFITLIMIPILLSGCVSLSIGNDKVTKPKGVIYSAPSNPFSLGKTDSGDNLWISKSTGNSISFFAECSTGLDKKLETLESDSLSVLSHPEIISRSKENFNGRDALMTEAKGTVDGVLIGIQTLSFNKNGCSYTLTYVGILSKLASEKNHFTQFISHFRAP
jgi:hypothetical protein